jgi:hypothetical protein
MLFEEARSEALYCRRERLQNVIRNVSKGGSGSERRHFTLWAITKIAQALRDTAMAYP